MAENRFFYRDRYYIAAKMLENLEPGSLLDVGSRDCIFKKHIDQNKFRYFSADINGAHDYHINLEEKVQLKDKQFDYVIALDVLEHIDKIHQAFDETMRICKKKIIISLPNFSSIHMRIYFLLHGRFNTGKYLLSEKIPTDRHRWLTIYKESDGFVSLQSKKSGFKVVKVYFEKEDGVLSKILYIALPKNLKKIFCSKRSFWLLSRE